MCFWLWPFCLQGFFNSLRIELSDFPNIVISTVLPGPVQSKIVHNAFGEDLTTVNSFYPLQSYSLRLWGKKVSIRHTHDTTTWYLTGCLVPLPQPLTTPGSQEYKMPTSRCVRLMLIGMANSVKEMWIGQQPFLLYFYLWQYTPTLAWLISSILGRRRMQNFKAGLVCLLSFWRPCDLRYHEAYSALVY